MGPLQRNMRGVVTIIYYKHDALSTPAPSFADRSLRKEVRAGAEQYPGTQFVSHLDLQATRLRPEPPHCQLQCVRQSSLRDHREPDQKPRKAARNRRRPAPLVRRTPIAQNRLSVGGAPHQNFRSVHDEPTRANETKTDPTWSSSGRFAPTAATP